MKILAISNLYPPHEIGGYELRCRDACDRLQAFGHTVHVLTSDHHLPGRAAADEPTVSRKLKIHGMYGHPWLPIHRLHALEKHNHEALRRELAAVRPELIHVWNMGGISKSLLRRLELSGLPVVYDISDHWIARSLRADVWLSWWNAPGSSARTGARKTLEILGLRRRLDRATPTASWDELQFKRIYFCSAFMRDLTASRGWPVAHADVIHCGIDTAAFSIKPDHTRFEKLLWVGRLAEDKDPLTAVRALAAARRAGLSHLTLDLYGHGEPAFLARVEAEIHALGLTGHVQRKVAPAAEMRRLYAQYDALLFTSNWGEPFALTPLEAMASGLPVVTSLDGGQAELARHGSNCLVAAAANPDLYATRIAELAAAPQLRATLAASGLEEVRTRFDLEPISRQIEAFLLASLTS
ncbi:MAG: glycosyltransferase family 4 protein [Verrucomicrobia bacterium]|nr:glycosyltransferase family 4 protein [Verrucomicrobiota bacterium]